MALRDISNEDRTAGLFKKLRLELFENPCDISLVAIRDIPNEDKIAGLFETLRVKFLQVHVSSLVALGDIFNEVGNDWAL